MTLDSLLRSSGLPWLEAQVLAAHALGVPRAKLLAESNRHTPQDMATHIEALFARRRAGEPVAYLVGTCEFFGLEFAVTPAVLIPRPETELLVEWGLERIPRDRSCRVLDLATGSGCVAIALARERPRATVLATDVSEAALDVARLNARQLGIGNVEFQKSDWFDALKTQQFDVIVANPPYISAKDPHLAQGDLRFEPQSALVGGTDGLDAIRSIVSAAPAFLGGGGFLAFEHGYDQGPQCRELLNRRGYGRVFTLRDLAEIERVSGGIRPLSA